MKKKKSKEHNYLINSYGELSLKELDRICRDMDVIPTSVDRSKHISDSISTSMLSCDLIMGGGCPSCRWVTISGPEASGKSTLTYQIVKQAIKNLIPNNFFDFEGSMETEYIKSIFKTKKIENIFGLKDKNGKWVKIPKCIYHQPDVGEPVLRYMHKVLKSLPDKIFHNGQWYLVYDKEIKNFDKKLLKETKKWWIPSKNGGKVQMLWFIDSLPAMLPEARDENSDKSPMSLQARLFSDNLSLITTKLSKKRCSVVAVNQLRTSPKQLFGNPDYEPCGNAIKFYTDIRLRLYGISIPHASGMIEEEDCWNGEGKDTYRYIKIKTLKNKVFMPFKETIQRIWVTNKGKNGPGFDPFWDTFQFLKETEQIEGTRKGYQLIIPGPWEKKRRWLWKELKELVLHPKESTFKKFKIPFKKGNSNLRKTCRKQIEDGSAFDLYFRKSGKVKKK